jgi:hypothetical protein
MEDVSMRTATQLKFALLVISLLGVNPTGADAQSAASRKGELALKTGMRKLWSDHVVYTRQYIVDAAAGSPSADATSQRLLKNQEDIGNAIAPYYGSAAGAKLTDLLKQHILIAVDVVAAAKAGDNAKLTDADKRWHDNAADLATFLSSANRNWPKQTLLSMLNEHLALTTQEATARLQQKWDDDIAAFDKVYAQSMMMADALSNGIIKQFPGKVAAAERRHTASLPALVPAHTGR